MSISSLEAFTSASDRSVAGFAAKRSGDAAVQIANRASRQVIITRARSLLLSEFSRAAIGTGASAFPSRAALNANRLLACSLACRSIRPTEMASLSEPTVLGKRFAVSRKHCNASVGCNSAEDLCSHGFCRGHCGMPRCKHSLGRKLARRADEPVEPPNRAGEVEIMGRCCRTCRRAAKRCGLVPWTSPERCADISSSGVCSTIGRTSDSVGRGGSNVSAPSFACATSQFICAHGVLCQAAWTSRCQRRRATACSRSGR